MPSATSSKAFGMARTSTKRSLRKSVGAASKSGEGQRFFRVLCTAGQKDDVICFHAGRFACHASRSPGFARSVCAPSNLIEPVICTASSRAPRA